MDVLPASTSRLGRIAAVVPVCFLALLVGAAPATADSAPTYYFAGLTAATAVHLTVTQKPASSIITASLVDDAAAYAASAFDSGGGSEAQAAAYFPGNLVVQGPGLVCSQLFPCPAQPPAYPLLADASYPRSQHAHADSNQSPVGTGPVVVTPMQADANADQDTNDATTTGADVSLLAGTPAAITLGTAHATTTVTSTANGISLHVTSTVTDVTLAGLVHIASIRATDDVTIQAGAKPVDRPAVTVNGVTVAGQQASIDGTGIHVAGQNGPSLAQQVSQRGITIHTVGVTKSDTALGARSEATGLRIDFSVPVSGTPYIPNPLPSPFDVLPGVNANGTYLGTLTLGSAGIAAAGQSQPSFNLGQITTGGIVPPGTGVSAASAGVSGGSTSTQQAPPVTAPIVAAPSSGLRVLLDAFSLKNAYAVLALGTVLLFLGWRGTMVLRRAGRH